MTALFEKFITFGAGIMDEKELIRRLKDGGDGSEAGFRELYELYSPPYTASSIHTSSQPTRRVK